MTPEQAQAKQQGDRIISTSTGLSGSIDALNEAARKASSTARKRVGKTRQKRRIKRQ